MKTGRTTVSRNRHFPEPKEKPSTNVSLEVTSEVVKEVPVTATPNRKGSSPNVPDPAPSILTVHVPDISPDHVPDPDPVPDTLVKTHPYRSSQTAGQI